MSDEPESFILMCINQSIKHHPDEAAAEMLKLIRENARLEAENAMLKARLGQLCGLGWHYAYG